MKVEKFEDLNVWQLSRTLIVEIYEITSNQNFKKDYGLGNQIQRASVSVLSNIAEGFEKGYNKEFIRFLYIAKGSIGEVRAQLYVALDLNYISNETFNDLNEKTKKISGMISNLIKYLKGLE
ncbi:four helix bundle protein [bacterium]|nr:four helix bundle protein [bacterium]